MSDNIIRFTSGDDGKFFRAVVEKVNAENVPLSIDDAATMPAQAPEGWKLAPVDPTAMQTRAGQLGVTTTCANAIYRTMLAAAPAPPFCVSKFAESETQANLSRTSETQSEETKRCEYCDGSGDVHRADGEWLGRCICEAGEYDNAKDVALSLARDALDDLENYAGGFSVSGVYLADEIEGSRLLAKACDAITEIDNVIKGN